MGMVHGSGNAVPFHGDHHPVSIYVGDKPIFVPINQAQDGKTLTFENTYNDTAEVAVFGESTQDGEPTPEAPVPIESIKSVELVSSNADGSKSATRTIDLQGHELRSLPDGTRDELLVHSDGTVELVQRVGVYDVASDTGYIATNIDGVSKYFQQKLPGTIVSGDVIIKAGNQLCTHFVEDNPYTSKSTCAWMFSQDVSNYTIFRALIQGFSTAEQYRAFFGYNDVRVIYKSRNPQTIQLPSIDPLPTYHPYTFVDGNGADISAYVRVIPDPTSKMLVDGGE